MGRLTWQPSHIFFPWACSQSWLPQPLGFKGATLRSIDTLHIMFLISLQGVSLCQILFIYFFNARLCPWIRPSPKPVAHPPLEGCPVRRALPYTSSLSIQVAWQTFTTVSTWAAEMSLNCLFLGQPIFNLLPLPIEETIRLGYFVLLETNGSRDLHGVSLVYCQDGKDNQACFRVDCSNSWAGSTLTIILFQLPSGWPFS